MDHMKMKEAMDMIKKGMSMMDECMMSPEADKMEDMKDSEMMKMSAEEMRKKLPKAEEGY